MRYNAIDTCYKKAIEDYGVIAKVDENQTKVLIREVSDNYGIDYKKIISSIPLQQGNYVYINGVQYLICDIEEQLSQSVYNIGVFRKTLPILLGSTYKPLQAIVDRNKVSIMTSSTIQAEYDQYNFIIPTLGNKTGVNDTLVYDGGVYKVISVDTTKDGLLVITGKYQDIYNPHTYKITLSETSKTLKQTETYTIVATCTDNGTTVSNPQLSFVSNDTNIATVSSTGVVSCIGVGSTSITCTYQGVNAILNITVEAKPVEPVISYTTTWSNNNATLLRLMSASTMSATKLVNGVEDTSLVVSYVGDSTFNSLLSQKKISITKVNDRSFTIKNTGVNSGSYTINITLTDASTGATIETKTIKLSGV